MNRVALPFGSPNPIQQRVLDGFAAGKRIMLMVSGRQGGKSHLGARWLISRTTNPHSATKLAVVVAPTYRMARVAIRKLDEVLKADKRLWKRIKFTSQPIPTYVFPNGWVIEVHSTDDPEAVRGITAAAIWHDEAAKSAGVAFDVLMPTLLAEGGEYLATTTPRGKFNWTYSKLYLKSCPPGHPDHDPDLYNPIYGTVIGSTWENVENLSEEAVLALEDQYGKTSAFGLQEIAGEFVSFEGLVFKWHDRHFRPRAELPALSEYSVIAGGIDFGWTDPAVAVVLGYKDGNWYALDGVYESELLPDEFNEAVANLTRAYGVGVWYADSARPDAIAAMVSAGLPVRAVVKPEIEDRLREMAIFTDHGRFHVSYACPWVRDELFQYQYPPEERLARDAKRRPIDKANHAMDAIGYCLFMHRWLWRNDVAYRLVQEAEGDDPDDEAFVLKLKGKANKRAGRGPSGLYGR